jgi:Zn-dependent M28 family amino/carboxypeptidase
MRRILVISSAAVVLSFAMFSAAGTRRAHAQSKGKTTKGAKAASAASYGNADAITEEELKAYDYFLASDQLEGRYFPSRGYDTAALYVASHLAEWGLKPGGSTTGTNGPLQPYFMPMEMVAREIVPDESKATLVAPSGGRGRGNATAQTTTFEYGKDWTVGAAALPGGGGRGGAVPEAFDISANLVFAGNGYAIDKNMIDPYQGIEVKGKIIVVAGLPPEVAAQQAAGRGGRGRGGAGAAADVRDPLGENCKDYFTPEEYAARNGALAVVTIANFQSATAMAYPNAAGLGGRGGAGGGGRGGAALNGPPYTVARFRPTPPCPAAPNVAAGMALTSALFQGEKLTGAQVFFATESNARQDSFDLNSAKKLSLKLAVHSEPSHTENVIGILEGGDPVLKDEFVVMSAHLDHIGLSAPQPDGHNVNNGADDDGSGSTGLLGIAHAYARGAAQGIRPKRSILFLWDGGEERGLWGSQYFTQFPPIDLSKVVADLNMDMIGRTRNANSVDSNSQHFLVDPGGVLLIGPNISSDDLGQVIDTVNSSFQKLKIDHFYDVTAPDATHDNLGPQPNGQRIFYRSDHYNFAKMGIPIAFFTVGLHEDYHRPTDTPEKIDYKEIQVISKTVAAVAWELGNQSGRPKLKDKLPDQLVQDMKTAQRQGWGKITPVLPPLPGEPY